MPFIGVLGNIGVLGGTRCITILIEHLRVEVDNVESMDTTATKLDMIHERLGGNTGVDGIIVSELANPCVLDGVDDEVVTDAFGGFVKLEIVPQIFVDSLGVGADNGSGVVGNYQVDVRPCGKS